MTRSIIISFLLLPALTFGQSRTTQKFHEEHEDAQVLFFYKSTLKMLYEVVEIEETAELKDLLKDIETMKFVRVDKNKTEIDKSYFKELVDDYHDDDFEDLMTMRQEGMNINVYIKESGGETKGLVLLMDDDQNLAVLDIKGFVPLNKLAKLASTVQDVDAF
ncbi:MAG: DUF4252 domain-containing protein [Bacteroidota bacterium]